MENINLHNSISVNLEIKIAFFLNKDKRTNLIDTISNY